MFCSTSVIQHVLRGIGALALLVCAALVFQAYPLWALLPLAGALLLMRGCPMCWLVGLKVWPISHRAFRIPQK